MCQGNYFLRVLQEMDRSEKNNGGGGGGRA